MHAGIKRHFSVFLSIKTFMQSSARQTLAHNNRNFNFIACDLRPCRMSSHCPIHLNGSALCEAAQRMRLFYFADCAASCAHVGDRHRRRASGISR